ncbi:hypothetical protein Taro_017065, partial [Colocasia esculenta]|nr:hypothetical protein [Colocasia esculenta]
QFCWASQASRRFFAYEDYLRRTDQHLGQGSGHASSGQGSSSAGMSSNIPEVLVDIPRDGDPRVGPLDPFLTEQREKQPSISAAYKNLKICKEKIGRATVKGPVGGNRWEDLNVLANDDYNPIFDGTPSSDGAGLSQASPLEQGHLSVGLIAGEVAGGLDVNLSAPEGSTSLQAIHDLLTTVPEPEFPDYPDFNFIESDGGTGRSDDFLHSGASWHDPTRGGRDPKEAKRGEQRCGPLHRGVYMVRSPAVARSPTIAAVAGTEAISRSPTAISSPSGAGGPLAGGSVDALAGGCSRILEDSHLEVVAGDFGKATCPRDSGGSSLPSSGAQAVDGVLPQPSSSGDLPGLSDAFPSHDIQWPNLSQGALLQETEGALNFLMRGARAIAEENNPPSIEAVRDVFRRNTLAYHLMGHP